MSFFGNLFGSLGGPDAAATPTTPQPDPYGGYYNKKAAMLYALGNMGQGLGYGLMTRDWKNALNVSNADANGYQEQAMKKAASARMFEEADAKKQERARKEELGNKWKEFVANNSDKFGQYAEFAPYLEPSEGMQILSGMQPDWRPATQEERASLGVGADVPLVIGKDGPKVLGGGGTTTNNYVNVGGQTPDSKLRETLDTKEADAWNDYKKAGTVSGANNGDFAVLDELIKVAPQGPLIGNLAAKFPGFTSSGSAFQSVVKRVAPTLRVPGSGATSDIEYEGMLQSLPALANKPEANKLILEIMRAKANINVQRSQIITQYQKREIDVDTARQLIADLDAQSIMTPELQAALSGVSGPAAAPSVGGPRLRWNPKTGELE